MCHSLVISESLQEELHFSETSNTTTVSLILNGSFLYKNVALSFIKAPIRGHWSIEHRLKKPLNLHMSDLQVSAGSTWVCQRGQFPFLSRNHNFFCVFTIVGSATNSCICSTAVTWKVNMLPWSLKQLTRFGLNILPLPLTVSVSHNPDAAWVNHEVLYLHDIVFPGPVCHCWQLVLWCWKIHSRCFSR